MAGTSTRGKIKMFRQLGNAIHIRLDEIDKTKE